MIILTDVDEVLLDWATEFQTWLSVNYDINPDTVLTDHWHVDQFIGCSKEQADMYVENFINSEWFSELKPLEGVVDGINDLSNNGYEFVAITACGVTDSIKEKRWYNLTNVFGEVFSEIHFVEGHHSKKPYLEKYDSTYWVDDNPNHAIDGALCGHTTFLMDYPHNKNIKNDAIQRVSGWGEIVNKIL